MNEFILPIVIAVALAVVCGFWYSYYQSVKKLKAHDRESVRLMEQDIRTLERAGSPAEQVAAARRRLEEFRQKHKVT